MRLWDNIAQMGPVLGDQHRPGGGSKNRAPRNVTSPLHPLFGLYRSATVQFWLKEIYAGIALLGLVFG
jgi:hypothetical protein